MTTHEQEFIITEYGKFIKYIIYRDRFNKFLNSTLSVHDVYHDILIRIFNSKIDLTLEPKAIRSYIAKAIWHSALKSAARSFTIRIPDYLFMKMLRGNEELLKKILKNPGCRPIERLEKDPPEREQEERKPIKTPIDLEKYISTLNNREQFIIKSRFYYDRTLEAIGADLKMTKERIRQIENISINKIRLLIINDNDIPELNNILRKLIDEGNRYIPKETYELRGEKLEIKMRRFGL